MIEVESPSVTGYTIYSKSGCPIIKNSLFYSDNSFFDTIGFI